MKKYEKQRNRVGYIRLKDYELEEGTKENLKIGIEYIVSNSGINPKEEYYKDTIRKQYPFETNKEFRNYVDYIADCIKRKVIYKVIKK